MKRRLRFPMFAKFLLACLLLAGLLIYGGTVVVKQESQFRNRGTFLTKQLRRYEFYQERLGRALTGTTEILIGDATLRAALHATETPPAAGAPPPDLTTVAKSLHARVSEKNGIQPDVFVIFSATGK
ncbi:MAG: hypothetical protein H0T79_23335, partial [Deltaproteobacteria bacterium]|nr:hypothetical protein [Deltaproteobacteria bacterium]